MQSWSPKESYDNASLLLTVCALQEGKSNPFEGFDRQVEQGMNKQCKSSKHSPFKERRDKTRQSLNSLLLATQGTTTEGSVQIYGRDIIAIGKKRKNPIDGMKEVTNFLKDA